jgi:hypothetical protein
MDSEVFGSPEQQAVLARGLALHDLLADHPAMTYYGRGVGVLWGEPGAVDLMARLATVQGVSNCSFIPDEQAPALRSDLEDHGYSITHYACWEGGEGALSAAERILAEHDPAEDIVIHVIDAHSPASHLQALAEVSLGAGVLPVAGCVLRGQRRPAVSVVALDAEGRGVSCAAAATYAHPDHPEFGKVAWWGMLATRPDRKGERLALILGAIALREMRRRHGIERFFTGVTAGNAASEAVCRRSGFAPRGRSIISPVDPRVVSGGKLTK